MASGAVGIVRSILRDTHQVVVEALGSQGPERSGLSASRPLLYPTYLGKPPPPHSWVELTQLQGGVWHVADAGPRADRREIFHDDFNTAHDANPILFADSEWFLAANPGGSVYQFVPTGGGCMGVAYLVTNSLTNESTTIYKDPAGGLLERSRGYWFSSRLANGYNGGADFAVVIGLSDLAGNDAYFALLSAFGGIMTFNTADAGVGSNVVLPFAPADGEFFWMDILLVPGAYLAGWFNGAGPYLLTGNVPPDGSSTAAFAFVRTTVDDFKTMFIDSIHVETFAPVAPLSQIALPGFTAA